MIASLRAAGLDDTLPNYWFEDPRQEEPIEEITDPQTQLQEECAPRPPPNQLSPRTSIHEAGQGGESRGQSAAFHLARPR